MSRGRTTSLRMRLFRTIILALLITALCASIVRFVLARDMSNRLYDNTLEVVALTISRDVVLTEGDLLAEVLLARLVAALGDPIYYRVIGPGGRFVTGYSDGPTGSPARDGTLETGVTIFYDGVHSGEPVRGVVLREFVADDRFDGWTTVEVWQTIDERRDLALQLLGQTLAILANLLVIAAISILFAIDAGLRPLVDLSASLRRRTPQDLAPVAGDLPREIAPLRDALNGLIAEVSEAMQKRNAFISDAAHQIRNPIAGIAALLDVAHTAKSDQERLEIVEEAQRAMSRVRRLTSQLLSLETLEGRTDAREGVAIDLAVLAADLARRISPEVIAAGSDLQFDAPSTPAMTLAPTGLLDEAVENLLHNACIYGLRKGGTLSVSVAFERDLVRLTVEDDGPGVRPEDTERIFDRFNRGGEDGHLGSGLGLAIARRIAESCGGALRLAPCDTGARFVMTLPRHQVSKHDGGIPRNDR